jgi:hypothetical protein
MTDAWKFQGSFEAGAIAGSKGHAHSLPGES